MSDITLYGAGGHCKVVIDILEANGHKIKNIIDDNASKKDFLGVPITKAADQFENLIVTIGNCLTRKRIIESTIAENHPTAIHPTATISPHCHIGEGTVVMQGAIIQSCAIIGKHCIINTGSTIDHDSVLADYVHCASGSTICGNVTIGECSWIGANAVVIQGINIGKNVMVGAGAVVIRDIPDNVTVVGNPAKIIKRNK